MIIEKMYTPDFLDGIFGLKKGIEYYSGGEYYEWARHNDYMYSLYKGANHNPIYGFKLKSKQND